MFQRDRSGRAFGSLVMIILVVVAPILARGASADISTPSSGPTSSVFDGVSLRLDQVWRYVENDAGGHSDIENFAGLPSLEQTAWNLKLAAHYGIDVDRLDRQRTIAWIQTALERPDQYPLPSELFRLELATRALLQLAARPAAALVVDRIEALRSGWGYRDLPGQPPSWSATLLATRVLERVGAVPPPTVVDEVRRQLPILAAAPVLANGEGWELDSLWGTAHRVLPADELQSFRPVVSQRFGTRVDQIEEAGCTSSWTIWNYGSLAVVADETEITLALPVLTECFVALESPNGYLAFSSAQHDLVATYLAARLGRTSPPRLIEMITTTAGPTGWFEVLQTVSPESTYRGVLLDHALGRISRDDGVTRIAKSWLEEFTDLHGRPDALRGELADQQYVLLLAREMGVSISDTVSHEVTALTAQAERDAWSVDERIYLLRYAAILDIGVPDSFLRSVQGELFGAPSPTIREVRFLVYLQDEDPCRRRRFRSCGTGDWPESLRRSRRHRGCSAARRHGNRSVWTRTTRG